MEQPGDWVLDELNKRVVAEPLIEKSRSGRVTRHSENALIPAGLAGPEGVGFLLVNAAHVPLRAGTQTRLLEWTPTYRE
jgi:hypothetical protein